MHIQSKETIYMYINWLDVLVYTNYIIYHCTVTHTMQYMYVYM